MREWRLEGDMGDMSPGFPSSVELPLELLSGLTGSGDRSSREIGGVGEGDMVLVGPSSSFV